MRIASLVSHTRTDTLLIGVVVGDGAVGKVSSGTILKQPEELGKLIWSLAIRHVS